MERLRREQEQREYAHLVSNREPADFAADDEKDDISPSLVLNILLSVVLCAAAVFHLTRWWSSDGIRVLLSLGTGIVVGVAEVGVYMAYLRKVRMSKTKERNKLERKSLIGEYKGELQSTDAHGRPVSIDAAAIIEKEEIWGRGINGGMRRRVREKWGKEQKKSP
jgi:TMEM199 family protein